MLVPFKEKVCIDKWGHPWVSTLCKIDKKVINTLKTKRIFAGTNHQRCFLTVPDMLHINNTVNLCLTFFTSCSRFFCEHQNVSKKCLVKLSSLIWISIFCILMSLNQYKCANSISSDFPSCFLLWDKTSFFIIPSFASTSWIRQFEKSPVLTKLLFGMSSYLFSIPYLSLTHNSLCQRRYGC